MALSVPDAATTAEINQQAHSDLGAAVAQAVAAAYATVDPHDLAGTLPRFRMMVTALVARFGQAAASLALAQYLASRREAVDAGIIAASTAPRLAPAAPDLKALDALIGWATSGLWTPAGASRDAAGQAQVATVALAKAQGVAEGIATTTGRQTTFSAIAQDRAAKGWARIPEVDACARCLMLALRGAVYKSESTADFAAHHVQPNGTGGECRCGVEPLFTRKFTPTAQVADAKRLWDESTDGLTGKDAERAFRAAIEGRDVSAQTIARRTPVAQVVTPSPGAAARIASQLENALATMRANNDRGRFDAAIAATERRVAELTA